MRPLRGEACDLKHSYSMHLFVALCCLRPSGSALVADYDQSSGASLLYSGNYNNSSLNNVGSNGNWWSSTVNNTNNSYNLNVNSNGNVNPQNNNNKYNGFAVRCVATQ